MPVEVDHLRSKISSPYNNTSFLLNKETNLHKITRKEIGDRILGGVNLQKFNNLRTNCLKEKINKGRV